MISFNILINCLLDDVWILWGEVTSQSLLGVKGLTISSLHFSNSDFLCWLTYICWLWELGSWSDNIPFLYSRHQWACLCIDIVGAANNELVSSPGDFRWKNQGTCIFSDVLKSNLFSKIHPVIRHWKHDSEWQF